MTANYSTADALQSLCKSIPDWRVRLDELNEQIALRQVELARLEEGYRPPTRSIRNKGSTESLRPKDGDENPFSSREDTGVNGHNVEQDRRSSTRSPQSKSGRAARDATTPRPPSSSAAARRVPAPNASALNSDPRPLFFTLSRQSSHPTTPTQPRIKPTFLRKRKTESILSGDSASPKHRTRSMIIVYYDSAVQAAFEELVKFVSGSRNQMRKGKMAVKMAEIRRAAEFELDADETDDDEDGRAEVSYERQTHGASINVVTNSDRPGLGNGTDPSSTPVTTSQTPSPSHPVAHLRFLSTRQMGPSRDFASPASRIELSAAAPYRAEALRGYRRSLTGADEVFDELDRSLEWCQSQCELAAHQFLREGECPKEINAIKGRLEEMEGRAKRELEKIENCKEEDESRRKVECASPSGPFLRSPERKGRTNKPIQLRKDTSASKVLEVDDMDLDDEGIDGMEPMPRLVFKRAGDVIRG